MILGDLSPQVDHSKVEGALTSKPRSPLDFGTTGRAPPDDLRLIVHP